MYLFEFEFEFEFEFAVDARRLDDGLAMIDDG
jgi:hypothetical protein